MIQIDFAKSAGKIKPLHAINNGPLSSECVIDSSVYYRDIGIPYVRLHDVDYPSFKMVDIPKIFPNFDADPEDPSNYLFKETDQTIEAVVGTGAQVLYRLGTSIEHTRVKRHVIPPKSNSQWGKICLGIIKHYNDGWAEGFHYAIKYWEIWNEPDNASQMWVGGTAEDYYNLYVTASKIIKQYDPGLKLGGYAGHIPDPDSGDDYFTGFLARIRKEDAPLDFFSWHIYTDKVEAIVHRAVYVKQELHHYGFGDAEIFLDEWNFFDADWIKLRSADSEYERRNVFEKIRRPIGASFVIASIIRMQTLPVDIAFYYEGEPRREWCGIFDMYGCPIIGFYALKAFGLLYRDCEAVESSSGYENIYCLATRNHVLIANYGAPAGFYTVDLSNMKGGKVDTYLIDDLHCLELTRTEYFRGYRLQQKVHLGEHAIVLLKISDEEA
jgi:xylan 1,4-beta-xylosidase